MVACLREALTGFDKLGNSHGFDGKDLFLLSSVRGQLLLRLQNEEVPDERDRDQEYQNRGDCPFPSEIGFGSRPSILRGMRLNVRGWWQKS